MFNWLKRKSTRPASDNAGSHEGSKNILNIAEIPYESGAIQYRYARVMSEDGVKWLRHGLFIAYHEDGMISSEGTYVLGKEHGAWRDFHSNGQLAAEGEYEQGAEQGVWRFWDASGIEEECVVYSNGNEVES